MARHYYLTRSGSLKRKDNTLLFELSENEKEETEEIQEISDDETTKIGEGLGEDFLGDLLDEPLGEIESPELTEILDGENEKPVKVRNKRVLPVEDIDSLWVFRELDLNARVLNFLAQKKIPVHFFNYYGFYSGSYYPREYLQAGFLLVKQVAHYNSNLKRLRISKELIGAALHNILRNLRYYGTRGADLQWETEAVQTEVLRLESVKQINELMACEGRARTAYYRAFEMLWTEGLPAPADNLAWDCKPQHIVGSLFFFES